MMEDYMKGLERAMSRLPASKGTEDRFVIPPPKIFYEGKTTVLENFASIADALNRDPDHLMKFILQEMGTAGKIEGQHAVFQGRFTEQSLERHIDSYVQEYVICSECHRPDTQLIRSDRVLMLKCEACGAHRPVRKRKTKTVVPKDVIEEGETYELRIESVGRKGDGIARVDKFMIFVPGTAKGDIVRAKIKKISGTLAFSEIVEKKGSS